MNKIEDKRPNLGWRTCLGLVLFVVSIGWPILLPVFLILGASAATTATFSAVMIILADLMLVLGAAVAGKEGFEFIKQMVLGLLGKFGPPRDVSPWRHRIGLCLFCIPLIFGWAAPYFGHHLPGFESNEWIYAVAFDLMLLASLFILGGNFWDKLQSLIRQDPSAPPVHDQT